MATQKSIISFWQCTKVNTITVRDYSLLTLLKSEYGNVFEPWAPRQTFLDLPDISNLCWTFLTFRHTILWNIKALLKCPYRIHGHCHLIHGESVVFVTYWTSHGVFVAISYDISLKICCIWSFCTKNGCDIRSVHEIFFVAFFHFLGHLKQF